MASPEVKLPHNQRWIGGGPSSRPLQTVPVVVPGHLDRNGLSVKGNLRSKLK
jgi:hypothetical protein